MGKFGETVKYRIMEEKGILELTEKEMFDLEELTGEYYRLSVFNNNDGYRMDDLKGEVTIFKFPFTKEEYLSVFEDSPLPPTTENLRIIYAILVMMRACRTVEYGKPLPDKLEDMFPQVSEEEQQSEWYQEYMQDNYINLVNEFYYDHAKEDLLKLYIAMEEWKESVGSTEVTIKYGKGKSVKLKNKDNWFAKVLLSNHLENYLKYVKSREQAESELKRLKHKGKDGVMPLANNFLYGTCKMYADHTNDTTISKDFCLLLVKLYQLMEYPSDFIDKIQKDNDFSYLRARISALLSNPEKAFKHVETFLLSDTDRWKGHGSQLYYKMT